MKIKFNLKFHHKITLITSLLTLFGIIVGSFSFYFVSEQYIEDLFIDMIAERNQAAIDGINQFISTKLADLKIISSIPEIENWQKDPKKAELTLTKIRNIYRFYESIGIVDEKMITRVNTNRVNINELFPNTEILKESETKNEAHFAFSLNNSFRKGRVVAAAPISSRKDGFIVFEIAMSRIREHLANFEHPIGGYIVPSFNIRNPNGDSLYSTFHSDDQLKDLQPHKHRHDFEVQESSTYIYIKNKSRLLDANNSNFWVLETRIEKEQLEGPIHKMRDSLMVGLFIILLILVTFVYKWMAKHLHPLSELFIAMNRAGQWDFNKIEIKDSSDQDIKTLLEGFNSMLEKLEKSSIDLTNTSKFAALGEMASGIAHEINNPLQIIRGCNERIPRLVAQGDFEKVTEMTKKILSTTERIGKIVAALRTYARNENASKLDEEYLKKVIDDTLTFCDEKFRLANVIIKVDIQPEDLVIECRPVQLSQVFINLLNNAFDAIYGHEEKWIEIKATITDGKVKIRVTNSGPKIPKAIADKIFQPFYTTKEVGKGTGLGLSISKNIIESQNGSIQLNYESVHTQFEIELPMPVTEILENVA